MEFDTKTEAIEYYENLIDKLQGEIDDAQTLLDEWEDSEYDDEQDLSEGFDYLLEEIEPDFIHNGVVTDVPAFNECFNNWADSEEKDQRLHSQQIRQYIYCGKYAGQV